MKLLVSIHDVTPAHEASIRQLWSICTGAGITPALLVVPQWHGEWRLDAFPEFVEWLLASAASGAEIFLHGERHDEAGLPRQLRHHFRAFGRTSGEGEFLTLSRAESRDRIERGLALLRGLGFQVVGFVAPAWLTTAECEAAVHDSGLEISEDAATITVHRRLARVPAPVLRCSARTRSRALASSFVAGARWRLQRSRPVMRLALHPGDLADPTCARSVVRSIRRWVRVSDKARYAAL